MSRRTRLRFLPAVNPFSTNLFITSELQNLLINISENMKFAHILMILNLEIVEGLVGLLKLLIRDIMKHVYPYSG